MDGYAAVEGMEGLKEEYKGEETTNEYPRRPNMVATVCRVLHNRRIMELHVDIPDTIQDDKYDACASRNNNIPAVATSIPPFVPVESLDRIFVGVVGCVVVVVEDSIHV